MRTGRVWWGVRGAPAWGEVVVVWKPVGTVVGVRFRGPRDVSHRAQAPSSFSPSDTEIPLLLEVSNSSTQVLVATTLDMHLTSESGSSTSVTDRPVSLQVDPGTSSQLRTSFPLKWEELNPEVPEWMRQAMDSVSKLAAATSMAGTQFELKVSLFFEGQSRPATDVLPLRRNLGGVSFAV